MEQVCALKICHIQYKQIDFIKNINARKEKHMKKKTNEKSRIKYIKYNVLVPYKIT